MLVRTLPTGVPLTPVAVVGEIDIASVPALRRHLLALPDTSTILELSGVDLPSAAGLTEVVDLRDRLAGVDASLAVTAARPLVRQVLAITGLDDSIMLTDTVDDAVHLMTTASPHRRRPLSLVQPG